MSARVEPARARALKAAASAYLKAQTDEASAALRDLIVEHAVDLVGREVLTGLILASVNDEADEAAPKAAQPDLFGDDR